MTRSRQTPSHPPRNTRAIPWRDFARRARDWITPRLEPEECPPDRIESYVAHHRATSETIRRTMLGLIGFALYCLLTLGAPDANLLTGGSSIPIPFANASTSFPTFVFLAPLVIVALAIYMHVFIGHLRRFSSTRVEDRLPSLFNLDQGLPRLLVYLIFYWLCPVVLAAFAWKAAARSEGPLVVAFAGFATSGFLMAQVRRNTFSGIVLARVILWLLLLATASLAVYSSAVSVDQELWFPWRAWRLEGANLQDVNLRGARLKKARFHGAVLEGADFSRAQLRRARFRDADLRNALFERADLRRVDFRQARLDGAVMTEANLRYANVEGTDLRYVAFASYQLDGLCWDADTQFQTNATPRRAEPHHRCQDLW